MKFFYLTRWMSAAACLLVIGCLSLRATTLDFTLDDTQSTVTLSGNVLGINLQEQGPGSLTASYFGTIKADLTGAQIQFPGGSTLAARTNGVWSPGPGGSSSGPADYGAQASILGGVVKGALRNIVLDLTSGALPMNNGVFDGSALRFGFLTNGSSSFDYLAGPLGSASIALSGISTNKIVNGASLTTVGDTQTLTIQVDTEFKFTALVANDSTVHLTGKLVATKTAQPIITSIVVKNQTVTLQVQGAGSAPRLDSSTNLTQWTTRNPTITPQTGGAALSLPVDGPVEFYRAAK
jgi:hypothetical protein